MKEPTNKQPSTPLRVSWTGNNSLTTHKIDTMCLRKHSRVDSSMLIGWKMIVVTSGRMLFLLDNLHPIIPRKQQQNTHWRSTSLLSFRANLNHLFPHELTKNKMVTVERRGGALDYLFVFQQEEIGARSVLWVIKACLFRNQNWLLDRALHLVVIISSGSPSHTLNSIHMWELHHFSVVALYVCVVLCTCVPGT